MATTSKAWADAESDSEGEDLPTARKSAPQTDSGSTKASVSQYISQEKRYDQKPPEQSKRPLPNPNGPFVLFVGNMPFEATEDDVGNFFHNGGCNVVDVKIQYDRETGKSKGFAHVEMADLTSLEYALTANGTQFMGRRLNVDVNKPVRKGDRRDDRKNDRPRGDGRDMRGEKNDRRRHDTDHDTTPIERGVKVNNNRNERDKTAEYKGAKPAQTQSSSSDAATAPSFERKRIEIKPRTLPVGDSTELPTPSSYSSIFGNAKPRDEKTVDKKTLGGGSNALPEVPPTSETVANQMGKLAVAQSEVANVPPPSVPTSEGVTTESSTEKTSVTNNKDRKSPKNSWGRSEVDAHHSDGKTTTRNDVSRPSKSGDTGKGRSIGAARVESSGTAKGSGRGSDSRQQGRGGKGKGENKTQTATGASQRVSKAERNTTDAQVIENATTKPAAAPAKAEKPANANIFAVMADSDSEED